MRSPVCCAWNHSRKLIIKAFMARNIVTKKVGHLPVIENEQVIGMVTRSDLMVYFYDQLPK
ncbi:MAG: CBS domain-containing protein [Deltaproteobacteria bacterium]|nr:MAG: CBS domain-containing protein [Deltaproteobacteria bacterium]